VKLLIRFRYIQFGMWTPPLTSGTETNLKVGAHVRKNFLSSPYTFWLYKYN